MKIKWNKKYTTYAIYAALICAAIIFCIFVGIYMKYIWSGVLFVIDVFSPILYGCIIAYLLTPLMRIFERGLFAKIRHGMIRRGISVALTYIVFLSILSLLVYAVGPQLVQSLNELQKNLAVYSASLTDWLDSVSQNSSILASIINAIPFDFTIFTQPLEQLIQSTYELIKSFSPYIIGFISSFMIQLKNIFIGLIFAGYILLYKELVFAQVKKLLNAFLKPKTLQNIKAAIKATDKTFGQYFMGAFLDAIFVGVLTAIALIICKIPYVPLISVLIACTNIIPIFGPFIGAIPSFIIIFISNPLKALWFVIIILVIQQIDGNIIAPRIYSGTTGIPAIAVTASLIIMGGLFGVVGMIIGVPVFALIGKFLHTVTEKRLAAKAAAGGGGEGVTENEGTEAAVTETESIGETERSAETLETDEKETKAVKTAETVTADNKTEKTENPVETAAAAEKPEETDKTEKNSEESRDTETNEAPSAVSENASEKKADLANESISEEINEEMSSEDAPSEEKTESTASDNTVKEKETSSEVKKAVKKAKKEEKAARLKEKKSKKK